MWSFSSTKSARSYTAPVFYDATSDPGMEIFIPFDFGIYAFNGQGQILPGWPIKDNGSSLTAPALADITGDNIPELIITSQDSGNQTGITAYSLQGEKVWGRTKNDFNLGVAEQSPIVGDINSNGKIDLLANLQDHFPNAGIYIWEFNVNVERNQSNWPQFMRNAAHDTALPKSTPSDDTTPPTTSITSPTNGAVLSGLRNPVEATASDNIGVTRVEFYFNDNLVGSRTVAPYRFNWSTLSYADGQYRVKAKAFDAAGNQTTSSIVTVTVNNNGGGGGGDTTPPTTSITSPAAGSILRSIVNFTASASDNIGVTKVELYQGNTRIATDASSPYQFFWNSAEVNNGTYSFTTKAYDAAGNITTSAAVNYIVGN